MGNNNLTNDLAFEVKKELQSKRKDIKSFEELTAFLKDVSDNYDVDYESCVCAIGQALLATVYYFAHHFGVNGLQASSITWEFIKGWLNTGTAVGAKLLNYDDMLYPQYGGLFDKVLSQSIWEALQKEAENRLKNDAQSACPEVVAHWRSIVSGNVPFGYTVEDARNTSYFK